jgi:hypothetical protein
MPELNIVLDGDNAWPDLAARIAADPASVIHLGAGAPAIGVAALPAGMSSGKVSIALRIELPDGRTVIAETSWSLFATAARAISARYGWPW